MASVNRSPFAIIVAPDLWVRRFEVTVEPPAIAHPPATGISRPRVVL
jgi:hypothetical protein